MSGSVICHKKSTSNDQHLRGSNVPKVKVYNIFEFQIGVLCTVIAVIWLLFAVPIVIYHLQQQVYVMFLAVQL